MPSVTKVAVTIPIETLKALDRERHRIGASRSSLVASAIRQWLLTRASSSDEERYVLGYLRLPERPNEKVAAAAVSASEPWE
jgi:metal-responsive CopG/Arc/MetJ family transcriptional regulator